MIYNDLTWDTSEQSRQLLADNNINSVLGTDGRSISVRREDRNQARMLIETSSIKGVETWSFGDVLANTGMSTTQTLTKESLRQLYKSEVEGLLRAFNGVQGAQVDLYIPDDSNFYITAPRKATAAIHLSTSSTLTRADGEIMARLVAKAVPNLALEDIFITDSNFTPLYSGEAATEGAIDRQHEAELSVRAYLEGQVKSALGRQYADVQTISNLTFDWNKITEQSTQYSGPDPEGSTGYVRQEQTEKSSVTDSSNDAEPGTGSNDQQSPTYQTGNGSSSSGTSSNRATEYLYDQLSRSTEFSVGNFLKGNSSLSIFAYNYREYHESDVRKAGLLDDITWQEFQNTVPKSTKLEVDEDLMTAIRIGTGIESISLVAYELPHFVSAEVKSVKFEQIVILVILFLLIILLAYGLLKKTQGDEITEIEPALSVEELLVSTQLEEKREAEIEEMERLREIEFNQDSEVKKQIEKFVTEKPEAAAQLLRNWLEDEWE